MDRESLKERSSQQDENHMWISVRVPRLLGSEYKALLANEDNTASRDLRRYMKSRVLNGGGDD